MAFDNSFKSKFPELTGEQLEVIQGDIWSKGFPKFNETYYLFSIATGVENAKAFAQCLRTLATHQPPLISNLNKAKEDQRKVAAELANARKESRARNTIPVPNALIAFTGKGLEVIQTGLKKNSLELAAAKDADPAFFSGMLSEKVRNALNDPPLSSLEPLFRKPGEIHGLLKVAGSSPTEVDDLLGKIQTILKRGTVIQNVQGELPSTTSDSRIDGWTRPEPSRGKEHFGFEDGISQPLMAPIDVTPPPPPDVTLLPPDIKALTIDNMDTDPKILIVMGKQPGRKASRVEGSEIERPDWMHDGSFLVFRKLEQNVKAFEELTGEYKKYGCENEAQLGAKLMGRWQSGAPLALPRFNTKDAPESEHEIVKHMNNFSYPPADNTAQLPVCPFSAHIRKTNPRTNSSPNGADERLPFTKIIRNGIPYGPDYKKGEADGLERGLLFACYQAHIEDGFQHMQTAWSNTVTFGVPGTGLDPIIGQAKQLPDGGKAEMKATITDGKAQNKVEVTIKTQLVTLKGGEYFFVPSIKALKGALSEAAA